MQKARPEVERLAAQLRQEQEVFCSSVHKLKATQNLSEPAEARAAIMLKCSYDTFGTLVTMHNKPRSMTAKQYRMHPPEPSPMCSEQEPKGNGGLPKEACRNLEEKQLSSSEERLAHSCPSTGFHWLLLKFAKLSSCQGGHSCRHCSLQHCVSSSKCCSLYCVCSVDWPSRLC